MYRAEIVIKTTRRLVVDGFLDTENHVVNFCPVSMEELTVNVDGSPEDNCIYPW